MAVDAYDVELVMGAESALEDARSSADEARLRARWAAELADREDRAKVGEILLARAGVDESFDGFGKLLTPLTVPSDVTLIGRGILGRGAAEVLVEFLTGHSLVFAAPPFEPIEPSRMGHTGHPPKTQYAGAGGDWLQIVTAIDDESSNAWSAPELRIPIEPLYSQLSFRPFVEYWGQRYLAASGAGSSHSDASVKAAVYSFRHDWSDWRIDGWAVGQELWNSRASGPYEKFGHQLNSPDPDVEGTVWPPNLEVKVGDVDATRIYRGVVWAESHCDADGDHFGYASKASVALNVWVKWAAIEQQGPWYAP